jgi:hypothetical protein
MKLIELHILQSFPVSCLNRDDEDGYFRRRQPGAYPANA